MNAEEAAKFEELLNPRGIAIIGATENPMSGGYSFIRAYLTSTYPQDKIYPINPKRNEVFGLKAYPNLQSIPYPVDYAIIGIPKEIILETLESCVEKGVKLVHIFTAGFSELVGYKEEGKKLEQAMSQITKGKLRILGPNCMGIYIPKNGLVLAAELPVGLENSGKIAFVSQSGAFTHIFTIMSHYNGLKFSKMFSYGNGIDINCPEILEYLNEHDSDTEIIFQYLEGFRDKKTAKRYYKVLKNLKKPLILLKGGLTEAGSRVTMSHTSSLAGTIEIYNSLIKQMGIIEVHSLQEALDALKLFYFCKPYPKGNRVGLIGGGGGNSVMIADIFARAGLKVPNLDRETESQIQSWIGEQFINGTISCNPIDLNAAGFDNRILKKVIKAFDDSPQIDVLVIFENIDFLIGFAKKMKLEGLSKGFYRFFVRLKKKLKKNIIIISVPVIKEADVLAEAFEVEKLLFGAEIPVMNSNEGTANALAKLIQYTEFIKKNNL
ncbi:MAG: CoA-binding protein [Candidatus Helarchaeota archaeon]|nr:CoA-binding protein [Candidatus Helarchaeota archaeon]